MANEDMDGVFFGGGGIDHLFKDGNLFLRADQMIMLFTTVGLKLGVSAIQLNEESTAGGAHMLLTIAQQLDILNSELLKREAEALVGELPGLDEV